MRGAAAGLLYGAARLSDAELASAVDGHLNGLMPARDAVAFLRGLLQTAREAAWQQPELLAVLDRLLLQWDETGFVAALPELRLAFAEMTPKETTASRRPWPSCTAKKNSARWCSATSRPKKCRPTCCCHSNCSRSSRPTAWATGSRRGEDMSPNGRPKGSYTAVRSTEVA